MLVSYVLFNLEHIFIKQQENIETESFEQNDLPESIEQFLNLSINSTHCLENYAVTETNNSTSKLYKRALQIKANVKKYSEKIDKLIILRGQIKQVF